MVEQVQRKKDVMSLSSLVDSFVQKYSGKKIDFDGQYQGQCVDLFRQFTKEILQLPQPKTVIGAADFWLLFDSDPHLVNNYEKIKNTPEFVPQKGDVMIWNKKAGGGFGHIAVVCDDKATTLMFRSFDQNWKSLNVCEVTEHTYTNVYGVLRPKVFTETTDTLPVEKKTFEELVTKASKYDQAQQDLEEERTRTRSLTDEITGLKARVTEAEGRADARLNAIEDLSITFKCEPNIEAVKAAAESIIKNEYEKDKKIASLEKKVFEVEDFYKEKVTSIETRLESILKEHEQDELEWIDEMQKKQQQIKRLQQEVKDLKEERKKQKSFFDLIREIIYHTKKEL